MTLAGLLELALPGADFSQTEQGVGHGALAACLAADGQGGFEALAGGGEVPLIQEESPQIVERGNLADLLPGFLPELQREVVPLAGARQVSPATEGHAEVVQGIGLAALVPL